METAVSAQVHPGVTPAAGVAPGNGGARIQSVLDSSAHPWVARPIGRAEGVVTDVNYAGGVMIIRSGGRSIEVVVLPSTPIVGRSSAFYAFSDIRRGARVQVLMNQRGSTYVAQMITLF